MPAGWYQAARADQLGYARHNRIGGSANGWRPSPLSASFEHGGDQPDADQGSHTEIDAAWECPLQYRG
jgi:hypothetical protein